MLAFGRELARTAAAAAPASLAGLELGPRPAAIAQSAPIAASLIASKAFDTFRRAGAGSLPGVLERSARLSPPIAGGHGLPAGPVWSARLSPVSTFRPLALQGPRPPGVWSSPALSAWRVLHSSAAAHAGADAGSSSGSEGGFRSRSDKSAGGQSARARDGFGLLAGAGAALAVAGTAVYVLKSREACHAEAAGGGSGDTKEDGDAPTSSPAPVVAQFGDASGPEAAASNPLRKEELPKSLRALVKLMYFGLEYFEIVSKVKEMVGGFLRSQRPRVSRWVARIRQWAPRIQILEPMVMMVMTVSQRMSIDSVLQLAIAAGSLALYVCDIDLLSEVVLRVRDLISRISRSISISYHQYMRSDRPRVELQIV